MSCFRGYIEILDSITFKNHLVWDNDIKKNKIHKNGKQKGLQREAQKLGVMQ